MNDTDTEPEELDSAPLPNSQGWQRRLLVTLLSCFVVAVIVGLAIVASERTRPPRLVYPASVQGTIEAGVAELRVVRTGERPVSEETLKALLKVYGLEGCQVGGKYGALCQDGTFERSSLLREDQLDEVCSQNGGVKEWIECR